MTVANNIVYPTDFSELSLKSLPWAKRMAAVLRAELHCIYVVQEPVIYSSLELGAAAIPTVAELSTAGTERLTQFVAEHFGADDSQITAKIIVGRPAQEIVSYANNKEASLIIMSTHGYSGVKHMLMGSTTEAVLREATCPVLAVPGQPT
jgi:nucleotide-binding universal stress UspA family protein